MISKSLGAASRARGSKASDRPRDAVCKIRDIWGVACYPRETVDTYADRIASPGRRVQSYAGTMARLLAQKGYVGAALAWS